MDIQTACVMLWKNPILANIQNKHIHEKLLILQNTIQSGKLFVSKSNNLHVLYKLNKY